MGYNLVMSEREEKRGGAGCFICGAVLFMLPVLYVLSVGPAAWLGDQYPAAEDFLEWVYKPLSFVAVNWTSAGRFFSWYIDLWV